MYTNFKELRKAYGFDNTSKTRDNLTETEEDCEVMWFEEH